jgi:L-lactate dehydrogenase complex protein LldE
VVRAAKASEAAGREEARGTLRRLRVALFIACFNDTLFPETGKAVVRLLERLGHEVVFPEEQTCCGQMHANSGYDAEAVPLARRFVHVFAQHDAIVTPSGSCAAMVREGYPRLAGLAGDDALAAEVQALAPRVHELSELLVDVLGMEDVGAYYPHRVTYHPTCHGLRLLRVGDRPLRLLRAVRGIDLVELPEAETCCGFGGTFAVKNADTSAAMLTDKLRAVLDTRAEICTALDNSCLLHIGGGLSRARAGTRTVHLAEILASTERSEG